MAIHARFSGSSLDPDDSSEDVTVTFATAVVRLASLDISAAVKWHQRNRAGGGAWWDAPRQLTPAKWELKGTGTRSFAAFAGPAPTPLYTLLARRKEPHRLLLFTAGANPPLGCFYVEEGAAGGGLLSLVGNLASSSASFLGRARGVVGMGVEANPNNHSGPSTPDAGSAARAKEKGKKREKIPATAAGQETAVWDDDKRSLATVSISPW